MSGLILFVVLKNHQKSMYEFNLVSGFLSDFFNKRFTFADFPEATLNTCPEAMQVTPGGADTHDDPNQRGAAREAAEPLFVQTFLLLLKISKASQCMFCINIPWSIR